MAERHIKLIPVNRFIGTKPINGKETLMTTDNLTARQKRFDDGDLSSSEFYKIKVASTVLTELPTEYLQLIIKARKIDGDDGAKALLELSPTLADMLMDD